MKRNITALLSVVATSVFAASAIGAPINYGDFDDFGGGGVIQYTDVTENSSTDPVPPPQFGAPDVLVNTLDFDPSGFGSSSGGATLDLTDGQLNFGFNTLPGVGITSLSISEGGDFTLFGLGTMATSVAYGIYAKVTVLEVDGVAVTPFNVIASVFNSSNLITSAGLNVPWSQGLFVDLGPALVFNGHGGFVNGVTLGEVVINDTLLSISEATSLAFIAKKDFNITPGGDLDPDNEIPEPAAAALVGLALMGMVAHRRV